jgi:uncharacterized protein YndB with AHSA1/START domain
MDTIIIDVKIKGNINIVWSKWTEAIHIKNWYFASEEWHVPWLEQTLEVGKGFVYRMEAKDGSMGFDFSGTYTEIIDKKSIVYVLDDDRKVITTFEEENNEVYLKQTFEVEDELSAEMQKRGWQAIINQFKKYVEE